MAHEDRRPSIGERRRYPRIDKSIEFQSKSDGGTAFDIVGRTKNLSCIGALCEVNRAMPEMTRLKIFIELPGGVAEFQGTVVRVAKNPSKVGVYEIAIYFNEISASTKKKIADFLAN